MSTTVARVGRIMNSRYSTVHRLEYCNSGMDSSFTNRESCDTQSGIPLYARLDLVLVLARAK